MQQEEGNRRPESASCNVTPEIFQRTPRDSGSGRNITLQEVKRRIHYTPHNSPNMYSKTPQSSGSFRKDAKSQLESNKRKVQSSHNESFEKVQKTCSSGKFVNTLIGQWSKHMGVQTPLSQTAVLQENLVTKKFDDEEMKQMHVMTERKIQKLQKKLQIAEETISSLSISHEAELRAKEEILQQLNSDWESITKYYYEISESLKGFQQHKDNLSKLYNDVIVIQQSTVKKLQQELSTMKLKDDEHKNIVSTIESKVINQEKRIQEMIISEVALKKQFEDTKNKLILEKNHLHNVHAEEKLGLIKKQENLTSINQELQVQVQKITEEKQNLINVFADKDDKITKLQEEIVICENKIENLLYQNTDLSVKYEKSINKEEELSKQLQSTAQELDRLKENLNARQDIESSLAKDLDMIENKYKTMQNNFINVENKLKEAQDCNSNLEKSLQTVKLDNEQKVLEFNRKIKLLEKEKERVFLEKNSKIQELENAYKLLKENHETEITSLKREFDDKLAKMEATIAKQNSAYIKLNETLTKINEENQARQVNYHDQHTKECRNKLQENLKEIVQPFVQSDPTQVIKGTQTQISQVRELQQQQFQDEENVDNSKIISKNKNKMSNQEQDIYNFNVTEINDDLQNILSPSKQGRKIRFHLNSPTKNITQSSTQMEEKQEKKNEDEENNFTVKKRIFKTRSTGFRQYGTPGKISRK